MVVDIETFLEDVRYLRSIRAIVKDKEVVDATGAGKGNVSAWLSGTKKPSEPFLQKFYSHYGKQLNRTNVVEEGMPIYGLSATGSNAMTVPVQTIVEVLKRAIESKNEVVVIADSDGKCIYVNDQLLFQTGFNREDMMGSKPGKILQGKAKPPGLEEIRMAIKNRIKFSGEVLNFTKSGKKIICKLDIIPLGHLFVGFSLFTEKDY